MMDFWANAIGNYLQALPLTIPMLLLLAACVSKWEQRR
jgi:hypothetical protein